LAHFIAVSITACRTLLHQFTTVNAIKVNDQFVTRNRLFQMSVCFHYNTVITATVKSVN